MREINQFDFAREVHLALLVESRDTGMFFVGRAINVLRFTRLGVLEFFRQRHQREQMSVRFGQRDFCADAQCVRNFARDWERDRNAPHKPIRQPH